MRITIGIPAALAGTLVLAVAIIAQRHMVPSESLRPLPLLRVKDYPQTYVTRIDVDVTSPAHVTLKWVGPNAGRHPVGPFRASVGRGWGTNNCNDPVESNCPNSRCTPKGSHIVQGVLDNLKSHPACRFATIVDSRRAIALHSHHSIPNKPISQGCIRLDPTPAQLIHDNCIVGVTIVKVFGEWAPPNEVEQ